MSLVVAALLAAASGCTGRGNSGTGTAGGSGAAAAAGGGGATGGAGAGGVTGAGGDDVGGSSGASGATGGAGSGGATAGRGGAGGVAGSTGGRGGTGGATGGAGGRGGTMATATRDFDLLFMIDNSSSMQVSQTAFINAFPSLVAALQALPGGMPNLHIAVVSSDMGAGTEWADCRGTGNSAEFQYLPRAPCTATTLKTAANYFISNVNGQANYTGTLDQVFRCIAPLGTMGCSFEQPLLSIERALGADGAPAPASNYSFLRPNADLILVLLTNEDDCSATGGASNPMFGGSGTDNLSGTFGPPSQFRCSEFGHMCDEGPPQRRGNVDEVKPHTNCRSNEHSAYIRSVASFARNIKALKPFPDQQISVVAITGVSPSDPNSAIPYSVKYTVRSISGDDPWPSVNQACGVSPTEPFGDPSLRVVEFTRQFGANGAVFSICRDDYAPVMDAIAQRIARRTQTTGAGGTTGTGGQGGAGQGGAGVGGAGGNCTADLIAGTYHLCARKTDGALWCWGKNDRGQLGDGTMGEDRRLPVQVAGLGTGIAEVSAGNYHTCAVKTDGTLWCWGFNDAGQLGDGTMTSSPMPVQVTALGANVAHVSAGGGYTCAIKKDTTLWCWGERFDGKLGYDGTTHEPLPKQVAAPANTGIAQVSTGYVHTCALRTDGSVYCWGSNVYGQLGAGAGAVGQVPLQVTDLSSGVASVSNRQDGSCVLKLDGTLWCWGSFSGDGTNVVRVRPVRISPTTNGFTQLESGSANCAARGDGSMACWGANAYGQIGMGTTTPGTRMLPYELTSVGDVAQLALATDTTCVRRKDNSVWCWGGNRFGELGDGSTTTPSLVPVRPRLCP